MTKPSIDHKALALALAKLATSGLDEEDAKTLKLDFLTALQVSKLSPAFRPLCSLRLNYHDYLGKPLPDGPGAKPFYRLRYLEQLQDFSSLTEKKQPRYVQEPNSAPVAYYPLNQAWVELVLDASQPLIITEGELKAACACKHGFPTIGIGGVHSWRAHKLGIEWLPSLQVIELVKRAVYVCFDSDYRTNPDVCLALRQLAEELTRRGAYVYLVSLPALPGLDKVGLDDFLVQAGPASAEMLNQLLHEAEPLGLARVLFQLNDQYVYVRQPGLILDQQTRYKSAPSAFKDYLEVKATYQERKLTAEGLVSYKAVSAAAAWLRWPLRQEVHKLTYQPGAERFLNGGALTTYNIWPGWGCEPKRGDAQPFLQLVAHLFKGAEPAAHEWFLRWCAYPLQYPGVKMFSSVLLHGIRHGTGKSLIGYTLGKIYGHNFTEINQADLHGSFNEWAEGKQLIMGDDITGSDKRADNDLLKKLITQKTLRVNGKYVPPFEIPDLINYFFTANHPDARFLEDDDRRSFIHEVVVAPLTEDFYMDYGLWLETGGAQAVFQHLLDLDLGAFNPSAPAFKTAAKERMIANVQSDLASWVRALRDVPGQVLKVGEAPLRQDLFTSKELLGLYDPLGQTRVTANGLGRELSRAGIRQVLEGRPLRLPDGAQARYYAVRNPLLWQEAAAKLLIEHLAKAGPAVAKKY